MKRFIFLSFVAGFLFMASCNSPETDTEKLNDSITDKSSLAESNTPLFLIENAEGEQGYANAKGDTIIPIGKYMMCVTDTFTNFAIVLHQGSGFVAIDQKENILYNIFMYDNGPDYLSDGLFRMIKNDKIGYADKDGKIIIQPQFICAYPFEDGKAKVSLNCETIEDAEHTVWESSDWYFINKSGNKTE